MPEQVEDAQYSHTSPEPQEIMNACLDAPGYVMFVGILSPERDAKGNNLINFHYRRVNFAYEDTKKAIEEFKKAYVNDVESV